MLTSSSAARYLVLPVLRFGRRRSGVCSCWPADRSRGLNDEPVRFSAWPPCSVVVVPVLDNKSLGGPQAFVSSAAASLRSLHLAAASGSSARMKAHTITQMQGKAPSDPVGVGPLDASSVAAGGVILVIESPKWTESILAKVLAHECTANVTAVVSVEAELRKRELLGSGCASSDLLRREGLAVLSEAFSLFRADCQRRCLSLIKWQPC